MFCILLNFLSNSVYMLSLFFLAAFKVERPEKFGGILIYSNFQDLEAAFAKEVSS